MVLDEGVLELAALPVARAYKAHPVFGYIFRENARDVLNKQNPSSVKKTLAHLATLVPRDPVSGVELTLH